ncbi:cadherin-like beta sandwich domain-containing protein [Paenibacillus sp.]|uniref:cadherin-like beta sandwich domain-containing protein n=1 Tax=Paenibacillus sp. TaxID=58172 RepID=UPI0028125652|nr:cadherin-like beta sandwich domain-containing protein [Paenibacillus sp.]
MRKHFRKGAYKWLLVGLIAWMSCIPLAGVPVAQAAEGDDLLGDLTVRADGTELELMGNSEGSWEPSFNPYVLGYDVTVGSADTLEITPQLNVPYVGKLKINGHKAEDNAPYTVPLRYGENWIEIDVIGEESTNTYFIRAIRRPFDVNGMSSIPAGAYDLDYPSGMDVDAAGNTYVADYSRHQVVKLSPTGEVLLTIGVFDDNGAIESLNYPSAVRVDDEGRIYVSDSSNDRIVVFSAAGSFVEFRGVGLLDDPKGFAIDDAGNLYVANSGSDRLVALLEDGNTWYWDNGGALADPMGAAVDAAGNVYVTERFPMMGGDIGVGTVYKVSANGEYLAEFPTSPPPLGTSEDGEGEMIDPFENSSTPKDVAIDAEGNLLLLDETKNKIQVFDPSSGELLDEWSGIGKQLAGLAISDDFVYGEQGTLYVTDTEHGTIVQANAFGEAEGYFDYPTNVAVDAAGNVYVADSGQGEIEKYDADGTKVAAFRQENFAPDLVAVSPAGVVYAAEAAAGRIVKFLADGTKDTDITVPNELHGIALSKHGNVLATETRYDVETPVGYVVEYSGASLEQTGLFEADQPRLIASDRKGFIYVSSGINKIQVFSADGTFAYELGAYPGAYDRLDYITGLAVNAAGHVFVGDSDNQTLHVFAPDGEYAGGLQQFLPDAEDYPYGLATDAAGNLIVADKNSHRVVRMDLVYDNRLNGLHADVGYFLSDFLPQEPNHVLMVPRNAETVELIPSLNDPRARLYVNGALQEDGSAPLEIPLEPGTETQLELRAVNAEDEAMTYSVRILPELAVSGDAFAALPAGEIVTFADREWMTVGDGSGKLVALEHYGEPTGWDDAFDYNAAASRTDDGYRFDSTHESSLAYRLNTNFLNLLDGEAYRKHWLVPMDIEVPYLLKTGGVIEVDESIEPYTAREKVALLTYAEYKALQTGGWLHPDDPVTGWDERWFLMNPIANAPETTPSWYQFHAFVQNYGSGEVDLFHTPFAAKPVIRLQDNIRIAGGSGTISEPYQLAFPEAPAESMSVTLGTPYTSANTSVSVAFAPSRSLDEGEVVRLTFPIEYGIGALTPESGVTVKVDGTPYVVEPMTMDNTVMFLLPTDVEYGQEAVVEFPETAEIYNPPFAEEGPFTFALELDGFEIASTAEVNVAYAPQLTITAETAEPGDFLTGQRRDIVFTVANVEGGPTAGEVRVSFHAMTSFQNLTLTGEGWTCSGGACTRSDSIEAGEAYETIIASVDVPAALTTSSGILRASLSGGNDGTTEDNSAWFTTSLYDLPHIVASTNHSDGAWLKKASATVTVAQTTYGRPLNDSSFLYAWSSSPETPASGWTAFASGDAIERTADGIWYLHLQAKDDRGNTAHVVTDPFRVDATPPTYAVSFLSGGIGYSPGAWTRHPVQATFEPTDGESEIARVEASANDGATWEESASIVLSADGEYMVKFKAYDQSENVIETASFDVRIDTTAPLLTAAATTEDGLPYAGGEWTTQRVRLAASAGDGSGSPVRTEYAVDGSVPAPLEGALEIDEEGEHLVTLRAIDEAGNVGEIQQWVRIDRTGPTMTVSFKTEDGSDYASGQLANQTVLLKEMHYSDNNGAVPTVDFSVNGGEWQPINALQPFSVSGEYALRFRATDSLGNETFETFLIRVAATAPELSWTASPLAPTNGNVEIRVTAADETIVKWAAGVRNADDFAIGGTTLTRGEDGMYSFDVTENGTYTIYATNASGLATLKTVIIHNIFREVPTASLAVTTTEVTNGNVTVLGIGYTTGSGNGLGALKWAYGELPVEYFASAGETLTYTENYAFEFEATENGTYTVYLSDQAGNKTVQTIAIGNIERRAPELALIAGTEAPTNQSVTLSVSEFVYGTDIGNALETLKWDYGALSKEHFADAGASIDLATRAFDVSANGWYTVYAKDRAGNETVAYTTVDNIYVTSPTITIARNPDAPTSGDVTVTVSVSVYGDGNTIQSIQWIGGDHVATLPAVAEQQVVVQEKGIYTIVVTDAAGNTMSQSVGIGNIFRNPPTIALALAPESQTYGAVKVIVAAEAIGSGNRLERVLWAPGELTADAFPTVGEAVFGSYFEVTANGAYTVYAEDAAGNRAVRTVVVGNIMPAPSALVPRAKYAAVDASGTKVTVVFTTPLDRAGAIPANGFVLSGANASITSAAVDPADDSGRTVVLTLVPNGNDASIVWSAAASLSIRSAAVYSSAGVGNPAVESLGVVTPAKRAALIEAINPAAGGGRIEINKVFAFLTSGVLVDINQDGFMDQSDIEFVLKLIEPRVLQ